MSCNDRAGLLWSNKMNCFELLSETKSIATHNTCRLKTKVQKLYLKNHQ